MALGRVDGAGGAGIRRPPMTKAQVLAELRRLGEYGDPGHPGYAQLRPAAIAAFVTDAYPRVDSERAGQIFDVFRQNPALIPAAPPPDVMIDRE